MSLKKKKKGHLYLIIVLCIVITGYVRSTLYGGIYIQDSILLNQGDTFSRFYDLLSSTEKLRLRRYMIFSSPDMSHLQIGTYVFSGTYTPEQFVKVIMNGPQSVYTKVTLLEGWSMYDIDQYLSQKGYITKGEYIKKVSNPEVIQSFSTRYSFLSQYISSHNGNIKNLEGLLYPDTYYIDTNKPVIDQLLKLQLDAFRDKVVVPYARQIDGFSSRLQSYNYSFTMGRYSLITLASIIEKEERSSINKPIIAGIFLNRIEKGMRIDADITLCYGLAQGYESCSPSLIVRNLSDSTNLYNTRVHNGLTPTPIANPSVETISALLGFEKTNNIYYLHDMEGRIWYAEDLQGHNNNKSKYL